MPNSASAQQLNNYDVNNNMSSSKLNGVIMNGEVNSNSSSSGGMSTNRVASSPKMSVDLKSFLKGELREFRHAIEDKPLNEDFHNATKAESAVESQTVIIERQGGLANHFVLFLLFVWYVFSALTLYTNKFIVSNRKSDSFVVGTIQMIVTSISGYIQLRQTLWNKSHPSYQLPSLSSPSKHYISPHFLKNMFIIGLLRLFSIVFGLMALKQAAISFVETVKSSSPIFTVIVSRLIIGEITGFWTNVSLFPIMFGLALCSSFEINFSLFGFIAAISTNFTECVQIVYTKLLLCGDHFKFTPLEVQFFSSVTSVVILVPMCLLTVDLSLEGFGFVNLFLFIINGVSFHMQTLLAFTLMSYISPVTYSVCNTLKRALLIWFSVLIFQNQVGYMSAIGTFMVIFGVLFYNQARNIDRASIQKL